MENYRLFIDFVRFDLSSNKPVLFPLSIFQLYFEKEKLFGKFK